MVKNKCVNMGWGPPRTPKHVSGWFVGPLDSVGTGSEVENFENKIRIFFDLHRVPHSGEHLEKASTNSEILFRPFK